MKKIVFRSLSLCFFCFFCFVLLLSLWSRQPQGSLLQKEEIYFVLEPKESLNSLSLRLRQEGLVSHSFLFKALVRVKSSYKSFQAGRYLFKPEMTPNDLIEAMSTGDIFNELIFRVSLPEGFSLSQVLDRLSKKGYSRSELEILSREKTFLAELGIGGTSLEGYLYPSTYSFYNERPTIAEVFKAMTSKFFEELPVDYERHLKEKGLTLQEALIIASLIEKETSVPHEKPLIAEVIFNRLDQKMTLGIDASLLYGIKNFDGNLTYKHLKDKSNLYNTRVHKGLPPGPICSPSRSSLEAVLTPSSQGYLFYVLKPGASQKEHHFSRDLSEHNSHVRNLLNK